MRQRQFNFICWLSWSISSNFGENSLFKCASQPAIAACNREKFINKSPAVARVSRPYSWCTLVSCVHNCQSMMFRTCCCLHPKCKRSYLLIYITSGSYVNKLNVRYLLEILVLQIAAKQLQLATWLLLTAYRNLPMPYPMVPSPTLCDVPFSHNTKRYRQTTDGQNIVP